MRGFGLLEKIGNVTEWCASMSLSESIAVLVGHTDVTAGNLWVC
jgi:formylglycine-generating enzyme required for sulfatase activity